MSSLWAWTSIVGLVGVLWIVANVYWSSWRFRKLKNLPPGSMGWPVIGETVTYIRKVRSETPHLYTREKEDKYGPIYKTSLTSGKTVMLTDAEGVKFVLQNDGILFETGYASSLTNVLGKYGMLFQYGDIHKRMRLMFKRLITSTPLKRHLTREIEILMKKGMDTWVIGKRTFLQDEIAKIVHSFLMKQQFGMEPGEISTIFLKEFHAMVGGIISIPVMIPGTPYYKAMKARGKLVKIMKEIIDSRRALGKKEEHKDILDVLMEEVQEHEVDADEIIIDNALINIINSEDVPGIVIAIAVKYLSENPKAQDQLRAENLAILKGRNPDDGLSWNEYMSLQFTQAVINETLRLATIAQGVMRRAIKDIEYRGYLIPKGWTVLPYFFNIHYDEKMFPEPTKFHPWRWLEKSIPSSHFWPFGGGPRVCPGQELARVQITLFLHHFVTKFKWEAEPDTVVHFPFVYFKNRLPLTLRPLT